MGVSKIIDYGSCWNRIWCQPEFHSSNGWLWKIGVLVLILYAITAMTFDYFGERMKILLILLGSIGLIKNNKEFWRSPFIWLLVACIMLQLITWGLSWLNHPEWAESSPKPSRLARWFIFLPVAWLLGGGIRNVFTLWIFAVVGIGIAPWLTESGGIQHFKLVLNGFRVDFGILNAQHGSLMFGACLLGLIVFGRRIVNGSRRKIRFKFFFLAIVIFYFSFLFYSTQSRSVILGLLLAIALLLALVGYNYLSKRKIKYFRPAISVTITTVILGVGLSLYMVGKITIERYEIDLKYHIREEIEVPFQGDLPIFKHQSVAIRIVSWANALRWIAERPLFGWGGGGRSLVIRKSGLPDSIKNKIRHLHSSYFDMSVNFGLTSLVLFLVLMGYLIHHSISIWRIGKLPTDFLLFFLTFCVYWFVVNFFESFMFYSSGLFIFAIVVGGVVSQFWRVEGENDDKVIWDEAIQSLSNKAVLPNKTM